MSAIGALAAKPLFSPLTAGRLSGILIALPIGNGERQWKAVCATDYLNSIMFKRASLSHNMR
jgi:hypothetical protein